MSMTSALGTSARDFGRHVSRHHCKERYEADGLFRSSGQSPNDGRDLSSIAAILTR